MMARLGDICTVVSGSTPNTSIGEYWDGEIKWITPAELDEDSFYITDSVRHITEQGKNKAGLPYMPVGTVILSSRAPIGKTAIAGCEMCCNQGFKNLICSEKIFNEYLYFFLKSKTDFLNSLGRGATFKELSKSIVENIDIPLPAYEIQKQISIQMKQIERLISLRKQQLSKLDELVKSRFIELFGDPEDSTMKWERTNFASVCLDMHQGINTVADKVEYVNSGFPIIQSKNITSGFLDLEDVRYVTESDYEYYRNKYNPKPSDLLVCNIGTIGKSLIVEDEVDFLIAWNLFLIKLNKELVNPIFIKVFIELLNQQNYFEKYMTGGTVKFVNKKTMGNISTPLPPLELQKQFASFVEQTEKSKFEIQKSFEKLETLKKALMQKYFG